MTIQLQTAEPLSPNPEPERRWKPILGVILLVVLVGAGYAFRDRIPFRSAAGQSIQQTAIPTPTLTPGISIGSSLPIPAASTFTAPTDPSSGLMVLAMEDGLNTHLFAFQPGVLPLTRLTNSPWDDLYPAISPDGTQLAYASRQNSYWDLYIRNLQSGDTTRVMDTPEYDGAPSWSPDGQWLAYETYINDNLDVVVRDLTKPEDAPIQLTEDPASDHSPAWAPGGREVAFVSNRTGDDDIWIAHLDRSDDRFENLTAGSGGQEMHPSWSPDGRYLAWGSNQNGNPQIFLWDSQNPERKPWSVASGDWPIWSPAGDQILTRITGPNQSGISVFDVASGGLIVPMIDLPENVEGIAWQSGMFSNLLPKYYLSQASLQKQALYQPKLTLSPITPKGRAGVVEVPDITAPYAYLQDSVDESFSALRSATADIAGWDFLANLENAYLPLTEPKHPGMSEEWLYTGRAFTVNPLPIQAGWMVVTRESFSGETYWRIFIKARYQDGSQGQPLKQSPWNLDARYSGEPISFEQGGAYAPVPSGYWIDFTDLAQRFDWQRVPALQNWRMYYPASRFNLFMMTGGLDWNGAMAEMYPPEALDPPTPIPTLTTTPVPTKTPRWGPTATIEPTPTITLTPTRRPTWTPLPATWQP